MSTQDHGQSEVPPEAVERGAFELRNFNGYDGVDADADARVVLKAAFPIIYRAALNEAINTLRVMRELGDPDD